MGQRCISHHPLAPSPNTQATHSMAGAASGAAPSIRSLSSGLSLLLTPWYLYCWAVVVGGMAEASCMGWSCGLQPEQHSHPLKASSDSLRRDWPGARPASAPPAPSPHCLRVMPSAQEAAQTQTKPERCPC